MTYLLIFDLQKFGNIKNIRRKCNSMVDLSKFTYNKMIFSGVVAIDYKQGCSQTFSLTNLSKYPTFIILANSSSHTLTLGSILISLFILILFFFLCPILFLIFFFLPYPHSSNFQLPNPQPPSISDFPIPTYHTTPTPPNNSNSNPKKNPN